MPSAHEHLSEQFQKWEIRGRGWQVYEQPVSPEPPFVPFRYRAMTERPAMDNGVRPSFLGSIFNKLMVPPTPPEPEVEDEPEAEPESLERNSLVELQVTLPADLDIGREAFAQLFSNLSLCREPVAFELLGAHKRVLAQFVAGEEDASMVRKQLTAYFPNASFHERIGTLDQAWENSDGEEVYVVEFGLEREFMLPLAGGKLDPFIGIVSALAELQPGELALFQVLWQPANEAWGENMVRSVTYPDGKPLFINAPELAQAAEAKASRPLYAVVVRMLVRTGDQARLHAIAREFAGSLRAFANPQGNALIPLHNDDYPLADHVLDTLYRQTRRSGMILGGDELFGFVHLPTVAVHTPELLRDLGRTKAAPASQSSGLLLGDNEHQDGMVPVYLSPDQRVRHTHIIGIPGTGKSSLLFNLIRQDIENGEGVAVLDPHGDLIDQILGIIPADRIDDVVLVDLSDTDFPIGFNILQAHSKDEKALLASDLVAVLRRFSTSWGDQMEIILLNAILAFLDSSRGGTLEDLSRFLFETPYRNQFLPTVTNPGLVHFWQNVFPKLGGSKSVSSVTVRLQNFFSREPLRNMLSQRENRLNFTDIMDNRKIFLAKLPEGLNGAENVYLLGSLLVAKLQQTAMARQSQLAADRKDFWLYVDEFDHFISPSMASILTGARKYRLGLTLGHQELHQLSSEPKVASAVNASICTRIVLRVGDDDAKKLADGFASFDAKSLKNLESYHAIARIERPDRDFNLTLRKPDLSDYSEARKDEVMAASRAKYAKPRADVEAEWLAKLNQKIVSPPPQTTPVATSPAVTEVPPVAERPHVAEVQKAAVIPKVAMPPPAKVENQSLTPEKISPAPEMMRSEIIEKPNPVAETSAKGNEPSRDFGRGGAQHKAMQKRLQEVAQKLNFQADIEKQLTQGSNQAADLLLCRGPLTIAVEISVTTSIDHEFENVQKCLAAGYERVAVVTTGQRRLEEIAVAVQAGLGSTAATKVGYYTPDEFEAELAKLAATAELPPPPTPLATAEKRDGVDIERIFPQRQSEEQRLKQKLNYEMMKRAMRP